MAMRTEDFSKAVAEESDGSRAASYVAELKEFFAGRGMKSGSPDDLAAFATALHEPGTFADELGSLMRSILYRERGAIALPHLLEIMTEAMGGAGIAQASEQVREPIRQLLLFLTTVMRKGRTPMPTETTRDQASFPSGAEETISPASMTSSSIEQSSVEAPPAPIAAPDPAPVSLPPASSENAPNFYARAQELIPPLAQPRVTTKSDQPPNREVVAPERVPAGKPLQPLRPQASHLKQPVAKPKPKALPRQTKNVIAVSAVLGLLLIAAAVFAGRGGRAAKAPAANPAIVTSSAAQELSRSQTNPAAQPNSQSTPLANAPGAALAPTGSVSVQAPNAQAQADQGGSTNPKPSAAELVDGNGQPSQNSVGSDSSQVIASQSAAGDGRSTSTPNKPSTMRVVPGRRRGVSVVSSGVMAGNLISAPAPKYPRLAGIFHVEGQVILQAVVSRDGRVAVTHVLRGHRLLRGAAQNAVRQWRYRPYLVNGQPTDVSTIVTVNFRQR